MHTHFATSQMDHSIIISKEGALHQYTLCNLFASGVESNKYQDSLACHNLSEKRRRYFAQFDRERVNNVSFKVNGTAINCVNEFKYLGRIGE